MRVFELFTLALCVAMATGRSPVIEPPERPVVERPNISGGNSESAGSAAKACLEPKVEGPCKALFPRYFYNTVTSSCERFTYGGCFGNANNFKTEEACKIKCMGQILG